MDGTMITRLVEPTLEFRDPRGIGRKKLFFPITLRTVPRNGNLPLRLATILPCLDQKDFGF